MSTRRSASPSIAPDATSITDFTSAVQYYLALRPRQLPSRYLYDALGSALFEAICRLPWYGITRAESRLLAAHAADILEPLAPLSRIVELGSGSGDKMRLLLGAAGADRAPLDVHLVDLSASALDAATQALAPLDGVTVTTHLARYESGLIEAVAGRDTGRTLVLFLGSNIGNFDPPGAAAMLRAIRASLRTGDALLLGADLVKPEADLRLAYDDPLGVTAAFNRNLLVRINRELAGTFDIDRFAHRAVWNDGESRVEMHLVADAAQEVTIARARLRLQFERGEAIWTESSYKYQPERIAATLEIAGFAVAGEWIDDRDRFGLTLATAL